MRRQASYIAITIILSVLVFTRSASADAEEIQREFILAGQAIAAGNLDTAAKILDALSRVSPTPRILLERARVAFLRGDYQRAQDLFDEVRETQNLPLRVREAIEVYDNQIRQHDAWWQYDVSLLAVQNPERQMTASSINIDGLIYRVNHKDNQDTIYGMRHAFSGATRPFNGFRLAGDLEFDDLEQDHRDTQRYAMRALFSPYEGQYRYMIGYYAERKDDVLRFTMPYLSLERILNGWRQRPLIASASLQFLDVRKFDYADATSVKIGGTQFLQKSQTTGLQTFWEKSWAREPFWSFSAASLGAFHTLYDSDNRFKLTASMRLRQSKFAEPDPFFARRRSDKLQFYNIILTHHAWIIDGRQLSFGYRYEKNNSNLPIQSYESQGLYFTLR
jgi:hypothetical protein